MEMHRVRHRALGLLEEYKDGPLGEAEVQEIFTDGGWDGRDHPAADFCHWMLWKLGCRDSRILSRNVPEVRIVRGDGLVQKLCGGAQRLGAWRGFQLDNEPRPGDIVLSGSRSRGEQEVARVFLAAGGPGTWRMLEARTDERDRLTLARSAFEVRGETLVRPGGKELLAGWVDLLLALGDNLD
jgi:hypothetical protein